MAMKLLTTNALSSSSESAFTSSIDSTYKLYIFKFISIHPSAGEGQFGFQVNASGESGYNETITSSAFKATHTEAGTGALAYSTYEDKPQGTTYQKLQSNEDDENDDAFSGELYLFNPSNTTYVTHFYSRMSSNWSSVGEQDYFIGGYINTTAAITAINFKMTATGNMDDGTIKMYGVG
jgi:hypothetical protein